MTINFDLEITKSKTKQQKSIYTVSSNEFCIDRIFIECVNMSDQLGKKVTGL